ncbi:MAG: ROK family protein [Acidimicrobiaceae bacterium]|nr:ROK family protein [Acidimicrobiaceae bacterium]
MPGNKSEVGAIKLSALDTWRGAYHPDIAAIDIGATNIRGVVLSKEGKLSQVARSPIDSGVDSADFVKLVADFAQYLEHWNSPGGHQPSLLVVALPGIVDEKRQELIGSANLPWSDLNWVPKLSQLLMVQVRITHDVRAALRAEVETGFLNGCSQGIAVSIGTGIGAGIVTDGRVLFGEGYAGEIGHINVGSDRECSCGAIGCLETVSSGPAISARYAEGTGKAGLEATEIAKRADAGDCVASEVWKQATDALALGLQASCSVLGTERVVLSGGLALAGQRLLEPLTQALERSLSFHKVPEIRISKYGDLATLHGAILEGLLLNQ